MEQYQFKDGQKVEYNNGLMRGVGVIVGCSTISFPVMGATYMVRDSSGNIPNERYPFQCFPCAEIHIKSL
jgi:hypothetical protein